MPLEVYKTLLVRWLIVKIKDKIPRYCIFSAHKEQGSCRFDFGWPKILPQINDRILLKRRSKLWMFLVANPQRGQLIRSIVMQRILGKKYSHRPNIHIRKVKKNLNWIQIGHRWGRIQIIRIDQSYLRWCLRQKSALGEGISHTTGRKNA